MKRYFLLLITLFSCSLSAGVSSQPHSFFMPRPISARSLLVNGSSFTMPAHSRQDSSISVEHTGFYLRSTNEEEAVPYFLGKGKTSLRVDESQSGDLNSDWFHILSATGKTYKSHIRVHPEREVWGVTLRMQQSLGEVYDGLWAAVSVPFVQVNHHLNVTETLDDAASVATTSTFTSVIKTLDWNNWRAGKWSEKSQTVSGTDDMCMQVGINLSGPLESTQRVYTELSVPVGSYPTAQYLFEPIIGSAGSFGLGGGIASTIPLIKGRDGINIMFLNQVHYRYHFSVRHQRTPDLKGQPFSRYLILMDTGLIANDANVGTKAANGVNFMTRECVVTPGATGQSLNGLELRVRGHAISMGYSYWWRAAEQVSFAKAPLRSFATPWKDGLVGADQAWLPAARIEDSFIETDPSKTTNAAKLYDVEFDMNSAAAPHTASHTIFGRYIGRSETSIGTFSINLGAAYEISDNCAALSSWQVWGGFGITG